MDDLIGKEIVHYRILEEIGRGGMGIVYKAHDTKLDRTVALKFLPPHLSASELERTRFIQEARTAAALNHPNVCAIIDVNEFSDTDSGKKQSFIVMEYIDGKTLRALVEDNRGAPLPVKDVLTYIAQIAEGLGKAHEKGIIHRDIKSENIMLTSEDGKLKIMDFGLARLPGTERLTRAGSTLGTLSYMSPEQTKGLNADQRSDIWSLGVVSYELLTGELPFKSEHEAALMYVIANEEPPPPSALDRKIPQAVDTVILKMLTKEASARYQTVPELLKDLEHLRSEIGKAAGSTKKKAIAVLPFDNISSDKENDYFSEGLTEELIANLTRLKEMRVISRTTTMQYKGTKKDIKTIGRELGARYIMEGSVRKFQDNLRITAQLIDVENDEQLWAETYKGKLEDVFDIQEQVSKQIVDALMVKLTTSEKIVLTKRATLNAEAFDCNLRARNFLYRRTKNSINFSIQLFQRATELDPRYAAAYAGLGEAYASLYQDVERNELWLDRAIEYSLKALMYDSSLPEAYAALGLAYYNKRSFDEAVTASRKAIELDPNNFIGYWILGRIFHGTDRDREAVDMLEKVVQLNPDFYSVYGDLQIVYARLGEKDLYQKILHTALDVYARYLSQHPDDARGHMYYATDLAQVGRIDAAKSEAEKAMELSPDDPLMLYNAACFYSQMSEKKLALGALKDAINAGYANYEWIKRDADLENIRNEAEYIELIKGR
jgi:adenylate cyclase